MTADQPNLVFDLWRAANALEYIAAQCMQLSKIALDRGTNGIENEQPEQHQPTRSNPPGNVYKQHKQTAYTRNEKIYKLRRLIDDKKLNIDDWYYLREHKLKLEDMDDDDLERMFRRNVREGA